MEPTGLELPPRHRPRLPNGTAPAEIQRAAEKMWELAARASRLEGELASHSRKLEAIEKRGRALRAEIGRKVEEFAGEESRAMREASAERQRAERLQKLRGEADMAFNQARQAVSQTGSAQAYQNAGAAHARSETLAMVIQDYENRALERERYGTGLRQQIDELKAQLQRYSEALENDLQSGRDRIAKRTHEALGYEAAFTDASTLLLTHLRDKPECRELHEDVAREMAEEQEHRHSGVAVASLAPPEMRRHN